MRASSTAISAKTHQSDLDAARSGQRASSDPMAQLNAEALVVSAQIHFKGIARGTIKEADLKEKIILFGQPPRFSLELIEGDERKIRIRDLKSSESKTLVLSLKKVFASLIQADKSQSINSFTTRIDLSDLGDDAKHFVLQLTWHKKAPSIFQYTQMNLGKILTRPHTLGVFHHFQGHFSGFHSLAETVTLKSGDIPCLRIVPLNKGQFEVRPLLQPITYKIGDDSSQESTAALTEKVSFSAAQLLRTELRVSGNIFRFSAVPYLQSSSFINKKPRTIEESERVWKRSLQGSLGLSLAILLALFLFPKPEQEPVKTEETLIPIQVAKIILSKPKVDSAAPAQAEKAKTATKPSTVANTAVVQAFRSKALQNSVKGLLKGGVSQLLAQSDLVAGVSKDSSQKLFGSKNAAIGTNLAAGVSDPTVAKVAAIGGKGEAGSVGYGTGEKAKVNGQGSSQVSLDIGASSVQEGLTKDEVGRVIHQHLSEVRYCYESAMLQSPDLQGKLTVAFTIAASGMVKTASVANSTVGEARLEDCLIRRLMTWKFPQPKGGVTVDVSYPFIFKTLGR